MKATLKGLQQPQPPAPPKKRKPEVAALLKNVKDKKSRAAVIAAEEIADTAAEWRERTATLLPSEPGFVEAEGMEKTFQFKQEDMKAAVAAGAARNVYELDLPEHGPYKVAYARNGRHLLLAGNKGHVAVMDVLRQSLVTEYFTRESTRDVVFLHNMTFHAVAQKKYVHIYDAKGTEIHVMKSHLQPHALDFLPYHFLLASVGATGYLKYQDTSTGQLVAEHRTKLGSCNVLRHNPHNAVIGLGHSNGCVTLWTPNMSTPLVKQLCHHGPVKALAFDVEGRYMVTTGADARMKVWDARMFKPVHDYFTTSPGTSLDISQRGLIAVTMNAHVQVWRDALTNKATSPYLRHSLPGKMLSSARFRPFEDILGLGHSDGFATMLVPGAGEANYDTFEADPFQTSTQRREQEVHALLDKLPPSTITLDPSTVGAYDRAPMAVKVAERKAMEEAAAAAKRPKKKRHRMRGRSKPSALQAQKRIDHEIKFNASQRERAASESAAGRANGGDGGPSSPARRNALSRFEGK